MQKNKTYPEWLLWLVVLFWGANYTVGKWGMAGFDPVSFNVLRFAGATPILFLLLYALEKDLHVELKDCLNLALIGLVGITLYQITFMSTVKYASATNASLLIATSPVFTAIFATLSGQEHMGVHGRWGTLLALLGVVLVILFGTSKLAVGWTVWRGDILGLIAGAIWGVYPVLTQGMLRKYSALKTTTYSALFGAMFLLLIGVPFLPKVIWHSIPWSAWGSLLFSIGPVTAFGLVAWYYGISKAGSNHIMAYMYAVPLVAVITAAFVLHEHMHILQIVGAAVIFLGIWLIRRDKQTKTSNV